jgi:ribose 5-phosphate isomerase A
MHCLGIIALGYFREMNFKEQAASKALEFVRSGMVIGLGSGSTASYFIHLLGRELKSGTLSDIQAIPTSEASAKLARQLDIPLTSLEMQATLDLAVDGADEVDPHLNLIKGLGRALLREKVIEVHARTFVVIVDESKLVERLGTLCPLPVEIIPFEASAHIRWLTSLGCQAELWLEPDGSPVVTDNGNNLVRCWFPDKRLDGQMNGIADPYELARKLADRPGIVEHGLFLDMASLVIMAGNFGIRTMER